MSNCISCQAALTGRYCANCGEKVLEGTDLDWRHFLFRELPHTIFEVDGALVRTLVSLFSRPGELAQAFVSGRRRPFITPLRLYLLAFVVYEVTLSLVGRGHPRMSLPARASLIDPTGFLKGLLAIRGPQYWANPATEAHIAEAGRWVGESGTFVISLFVALLQSLVFIRLKRRFLEHLALALNVATFYLLSFALGQLVVGVFATGRGPEIVGPLQTALAIIALPIYWFFGARRFYGISALWAGLSAVVMTLGNAIIAVTLNILIYALLILTA